jgi:SAM-dependent methyltransferase
MDPTPCPRKSVSLGHYVLGVEGLALLRTWLTGDRAAARAREEEVRTLVNRPADPPLATRFDVTELDFQAGYGAWAPTYDTTPNPLTRLEETVVRELIDRVPPGRALDAACGTGRHTRYLAAKGHRVVGVDGSAAMLAVARAQLPGVEFRTGDLAALPAQTASADLAVCALALCHFPDLTGPMRELARVVRPGGRVLISDPHPWMNALGGAAFFVGEDGTGTYVKNYFHPHAVYLRAFAGAGLAVRSCAEPVVGPVELELLSALLPLPGAGEALRAAFDGLPGALVWELERE